MELQDMLPALSEPGQGIARLSGRQPTMDELHTLEDAIRQLPEQECPVEHHFADGVYGRAMHIPAGTVLTGKVHRFSTLNVLVQGEITVTTPHGMQHLKAPAIFTSEPGCKKAGFAHTDVVWLNVHPTKLRDIASIEAKFILPEAPALIEGEAP
ncbi:hypothetical protein ACW0US_07055 [Xanthomonas euvesicatoria]